MRIFLAGLVASYFVFFFPGEGHSEPQMEVDLKPSKAVKAGETLYFLVQLSWRSEEGEYRFPLPSLVLENLALEARGEANETFQKEGMEWRKKSFRFELAPLRRGRAKILPFRIDYFDPSQQRNGHFEVGALELNVLPDYTMLYRFGLIAGGSLAGIGVLGSWILRRRIRRKGESTPDVESTLEAQTLSRLTTNREELFEAGKIFRTYVNEKFENQIPWDEMKTLKRIFDTLKEWQYSGSRHSREEGEKLYSEMIRYVEGKKII